MASTVSLGQIHTGENDAFKPLSASQARALREMSPTLRPGRVLITQTLLGLVLVLALWGWTGNPHWAWSAGYGALAVVLPGAVFARGLRGRVASLNPGTAVAGFFVWEMVKLALTLAMLIAAPGLVSELSWPSLLLGLVLALKVYWVALAFVPKRVLEQVETN
jgi:ATP synthase protein I